MMWLRLAVVLVLAGCTQASVAPVQELSVPVQLLTQPSDAPQGGCYTNAASGLLVVDPKYGTAIIDEDAAAVTHRAPRPAPVMWRPGFTGRRSGSEVQVIDPEGRVVAVTGHKYRLEGAYEAYVNAFLACGDVTSR